MSVLLEWLPVALSAMLVTLSLASFKLVNSSKALRELVNDQRKTLNEKSSVIETQQIALEKFRESHDRRAMSLGHSAQVIKALVIHLERAGYSVEIGSNSVAVHDEECEHCNPETKEEPN